jgi:hypothetical protein
MAKLISDQKENVHFTKKLLLGLTSIKEVSSSKKRDKISLRNLMVYYYDEYISGYC